MRILVTGGNGQLGRALKKCLNSSTHITALGSDLCNVTDMKSVLNAYSTYSPNLIIHCAAYTAVEKAETDSKICRLVNVLGTRNIVSVCSSTDTALMFLSTDYVFDDSISLPHQPNDVRKAVNIYGQSKIEAEDIVMTLSQYYIVRTSWLFGDGNNFVKTICNLAKDNKVINVIDDQIGSPTYSEDLANAIGELIKKAPFGIYHITNEGVCSWADLAEKALELIGSNTRINRISSQEYSAKAKRPYNSQLSKDKLDKYGISHLPCWEDALERYIKTWEKKI